MAGPGAARGGIRWAWVGGALLALLLALRALLPLALELAIERGGERGLSLPVQLADLDLSLLRGELVVEDLAVGAPAAGDGAPLRLSRGALRLSWPDLLRRRLHLRELSLERPRIRLGPRLEPFGTLTAAGGAQPAEPAAAAEPPRAWPVRLDRFRLAELDLQLAGQAEAAPPLTFRLEELRVADLALAGGELALAEIVLRGPRLELGREQLFGAGAAPDAGAAAVPTAPAREVGPAQAEAQPLRFRIERVAVEEAGVTLRGDAEPLAVSFSVEASGVSPRQGELFPLRLELRHGEGRLEVDGRIGLAPLAYQGRAAWSGLALPPFTVWLRPALAAWVRSCRASGELDLELRLGPGDPDAGLTARGRTRVEALELADPEAQELALGWQRLDLELSELRLPFAADAPARVQLASLRLVDPHLRYTRPAASLERLRAELAGGAAAAEAAPPPPAAPAPSPLELSLTELEASGGVVEFHDRGIAPAFRGRATELALSGRELRWPPPSARSLRFSGKALSGAPFALEGSLAADAADFRFDLDGLDLVPLAGYAAAASGYRVERGRSSLETGLRRRGEALEADNQLVLHDLHVSSQGEGYLERNLGVSVDLALALLRDPGGDISLAIPVRSGAGAASTSLAALLGSALRQALVGALSSPLKLAGAVLPSGGRPGAPGVEPLGALPGSAELAPGQEDRIPQLAQLLAARPDLALTLTGRVGPADPQALAEKGVADPARELEGLAEARARAVQAALLGSPGVAPGQIQVELRRAEGPPGVEIGLRREADVPRGESPGPDEARTATP